MKSAALKTSQLLLISMLFASACLASTPSVTVFGPITFTRATAYPIAVSKTFNVTEAGKASLIIQTGDKVGQRTKQRLCPSHS